MNVIERNHVRVTGVEGGPAILFAHGFGCDQNMWRLIAPDFERDHRVVLFDYVGHGGSNRAAYDPQRYGTLDGYASDVIDICAALALRDVTVVGHSVSGIVAVLAAIREPRLFGRLVLVAPSPSYIDDGDYRGGFSRADIDGLLDMLDSNYLGWASTMAPVIMANGDRPELATELENSFCRTDPAVAKHFARVTFLSDHRADLPATPVPALIIQVTNDAIAPVTVGDYMRAHMPGSQLARIDTAGHCPHLSAPAETLAAIRRFLATS
ncbi:MAG TPA: alpha/beta hydrolase [Kofleriaceae bacterium]|nr:alpha/beta hydrolase [Kofleriaceae bacterium]